MQIICESEGKESTEEMLTRSKRLIKSENILRLILNFCPPSLSEIGVLERKKKNIMIELHFKNIVIKK